MEEKGSHYSTTILADKVEIIQVKESLFELFIRDVKFEVFSSATAARQKIIEVVVETGKANPSIVPVLSKWEIADIVLEVDA